MKTQPKVIKESEMTRWGAQVTTVSKLGGIGLGYFLDNVVYQSGGNGFYYEMLDMKSYKKDYGEGYRKAIMNL